MTSTRRRGAVDVGPYHFSGGDVTATLRHCGELFDVLVDGVDPDIAEIAAPARARAIAATSHGSDGVATLWAALGETAAALRAAGAYGEPLTGNVVQLSTSSGGVPKLPVTAVDVDLGGIVGDVQRTRRHHGRPFQALCVWSAEVIDELAADGHSIGYGSAGENLTVAGLNWSRVRPGMLLCAGSVRAELSAWATPCAQNARWFSDRDFWRIDASRGPVSRLYATVLTPGSIAVGDRAVVGGEAS